MKAKNLKRSFLLSVLSLVLCISMFVGTTFAWFTDTVKSEKNLIKAGNLDIELYYMNDETADWTLVDEKTNIFKEDTLWEPGHTEVVKLKVVNEGTLALKYQLGVNIFKETESVNQLGKEFKLSDYIKYGVVPGADTYTRDTAIAAAEQVGVNPLNVDYIEAGTLLAANDQDTTDESIVTMVVYMPTTVGNEANYAKNAPAPEILLGLNLYATQMANEQDSFKEDYYDEDAWHPDMVVTHASELAKAIEAIPDGGIIALSENLTFDKDSAVSAGGGYYEGLYYTGDKSFTIDLNGKTITADSAVNDYLLLFKNDGAKDNTITLKNGTIEAPVSAYAAVCTSTFSTKKITVNLENVNVINDNANGAAVKVRGGTELNVKAGTVITGKDSYVCIEAVGANTVANVYEGTKFYQNGTSSYVGNLIGPSAGATVNVYGGYGKSAKGGFIIMSSGGTINVYGGEWIANGDGTVSNDNNAVLNAQKDNNEYPDDVKAVVNVYDGTFKGGYYCWNSVAGMAEINISGGAFNADPAAYVAAGSHALQVGDEYQVVPVSIDAIVTTAAELQAALDAASDETIIVLGADITGDVTVTQTDGVSITIAGNGYKYNGLMTVDGDGRQAGAETLTIKNVNFVAKEGADSCIYSPNRDDRTPAKYSYTHNVTVENCTFTDPDGVVGCAAIRHGDGGDKNWTVKKCTVDSTMHSLLQINNVAGDGIIIDGCTVNSKNGINLNQCEKVTVTNCNFDVKGYAVRLGASKGTTESFAEVCNISNSTLKSACNDDDAVIMFRLTSFNATLTLTNTKLEGTTEFKGKTADTVIIIDGIRIVEAPIKDAQPAPYEGDMYGEGTNVTSYKDLKLSGDAYISIDNNASVAMENVIADVNGSVIIMDEYQPAIYIKGCEFEIAEGKYLIDASAVEGGVYQIFLVDVKVNGAYLTNETAAPYLNNVNWYQALQSN